MPLTTEDYSVLLIQDSTVKNWYNVCKYPYQTSFEEVVREFLRTYFPKTLDISTGFLIDSNGNESNQMDIIISDGAKMCVNCRHHLRP